MYHSDHTVDFYPLISEFFQRHLNTASMAVDSIADSLSEAVVSASEAILNDKKLFSVGLGVDCASASTFASLLHRGLLRERPSLPVIELAEHHIESVETGTVWASQQIQALGQAGDVAIVFAASLSEQGISQLNHAVEQRQMQLIWMGNLGPGLCVSTNDDNLETRVTLNQILAVCLARLIDIHTFGPMEN